MLYPYKTLFLLIQIVNMTLPAYSEVIEVELVLLVMIQLYTCDLLT